MNKTQQGYFEAGKCIGCGADPVSKRLCQDCLDKHNEASNDLKKRNVAAGLCSWCGNSNNSDFRTCQRCRDLFNLRRSRLWKLMKKSFERFPKKLTFQEFFDRYYQGKTYQEVANEIGVSLGVLGRQYRRYFEPLLGGKMEQYSEVKAKKAMQRLQSKVFTREPLVSVAAEALKFGIRVEALPATRRRVLLNGKVAVVKSVTSPSTGYVEISFAEKGLSGAGFVVIIQHVGETSNFFVIPTGVITQRLEKNKKGRWAGYITDQPNPRSNYYFLWEYRSAWHLTGGK